MSHTIKSSLLTGAELDITPYDLQVQKGYILKPPGLKKGFTLQPPGSRTRVHLASGFKDENFPGFSIKLSANSDQSPPWGQRLILIKEKKNVLQAQLDPAQQRCPPLEHLLGPTWWFFLIIHFQAIGIKGTTTST
ncbi:hypothetical protein F2Q70_00031877 [Brassica cretica]|uniref:Uncharacterized protein n=1 Tax=Brassica cretica TaxID=69181 RepID=A0A8S9FDQ7_BRACR|nr:hypothetical protein F2Q70_00031877 [Brassica cretica]